MVLLETQMDCLMIDISCPKCQHKVSEQLGRLRADPHVTCPACHSVTNCDLTQLEP